MSLGGESLEIGLVARAGDDARTRPSELKRKAAAYPSTRAGDDDGAIT